MKKAALLYLITMIYFKNIHAQTGRQVWDKIQTQDTTTIAQWLHDGMNKDTAFWQDRTMLHIAVMGNRMKMVKWLVVKGCNINSQDADGMTPLHWAISKGDFEMTSFFLRYQPNLRLVNRRGESVLHLAAIHKQISMVKLLLRNGADKSIRDKYDLQPIDYAFDPDLRGLLYIDNK